MLFSQQDNHLNLQEFFSYEETKTIINFKRIKGNQNLLRRRHFTSVNIASSLFNKNEEMSKSQRVTSLHQRTRGLKNPRKAIHQKVRQDIFN